MTMSLARGLTTLNTKKPKKKKLTLAQISKYQEDMRKHNKEMRRIGCHNLQMEFPGDKLQQMVCVPQENVEKILQNSVETEPKLDDIGNPVFGFISWW